MSFRIEQKLLVDPQRLGDLYGWIGGNSGYTLYGRRLVFSTYFDNTSMSMFHDSEEGSVPRKKIRIRSYGVTSHVGVSKSLEIKVSSVEGRFKTSRGVDESELADLLTAGLFDEQYGMCRAVSCVAYTREYFAIARVRLTVDQDIKYRPVDSDFWVNDEAIAVEIKAPFGGHHDYLEKNFPFRRIGFSKYCRSINAIRSMSSAWV